MRHFEHHLHFSSSELDQHEGEREAEFSRAGATA